MTSVVARKGRHLQRYQDNFRLVSGCIPYRVKKEMDDNCCNIKDCIEVLMISTPNRHDLVFPKGGWENDESVDEAATREALEEAGVRGNLNKTELGVWEFRSKSKQHTIEGGCRGYMFALEVTEELDAWPEQQLYGRKWLSISEAERLCRYEWLREALKAFLKVMERDNKLGTNKDQREVMDLNVSSMSIMEDCHVVKPSSIDHCNRMNMLLGLH